MDTDVIIVAGIVLVILAIPSIVAAFSESRAPKVGAAVLILGGIMIGYAVIEKPGVYNMDTIPDAIVRVIGMVMN